MDSARFGVQDEGYLLSAGMRPLFTMPLHIPATNYAFFNEDIKYIHGGGLCCVAKIFVIDSTG
jgi:hypothetical protein